MFEDKTWTWLEENFWVDGDTFCIGTAIRRGTYDLDTLRRLADHLQDLVTPKRASDVQDREKLEQVRKRVDAAPYDDWESHDMLVVTPSDSARSAAIATGLPVTNRRICVAEPSHYLSEEECKAAAKFIAAARQDIPFLLALLDSKQKEVDELNGLIHDLTSPQGDNGDHWAAKVYRKGRKDCMDNLFKQLEKVVAQGEPGDAKKLTEAIISDFEQMEGESRAD
jgi:hypothetical protein